MPGRVDNASEGEHLAPHPNNLNYFLHCFVYLFFPLEIIHSLVLNKYSLSTYHVQPLFLALELELEKDKQVLDFWEFIIQ